MSRIKLPSPFGAGLLLALAVGCSDADRPIVDDVDNPPPVQASFALRAFGSCEQLEQHIEDAAVKQMELTVDGSGSYAMRGVAFDTTVAMGAPAAAESGNNSGSKAADPTSSTATNNQVAGVDEPDFVKNDGKRIFMLSGGKLHALKSWPPQDLARQGELEIEGRPTEMALHGDKNLIVVFSTVDQANETRQGASDALVAPSVGLRMPCFEDAVGGAAFRCGFVPTATKLSIVDVSDLSKLRLVREIYLPGNYAYARSVGASVRVVLRDDVRWPDGVEFYPNVDYPAYPQVGCGADPTGATTGDRVASSGGATPEGTFVASKDPGSAPAHDAGVAPTPGDAGAAPTDGMSYEACSKQQEELQQATQAEYEQRLKVARAALKVRNAKLIRAQTLAGWLPTGKARLADGAVVDLAYDCRDFSAADVSVRLGLASVITLNLDRPDAISRTSVVGEVDQIYASAESLYLASQHWWWTAKVGQRNHTYFHKFDIRDGNSARYVASGGVDGYVLNQFSMDEHEGFLRVATTVNENQQDPDQPWRTVTTNRVSVLGVDAGLLKVVGVTEDLAKGETIQSARFFGKRGFVVTFRQVDPLFALDLSQPTRPRVVGELKVPGFSSYIHPLGDDHLLTIGTYLPESGQGERRVQLAIFDVSDPAHPQQTFLQLVGSPNANSAAQWDHKAFNFFPEKGLLAVPYTDYRSWVGPADAESYWPGFVSELRVYQVDKDKGFTPRGAVSMSDVYARQGRYDWQWWYSPEVRRSVMASDDANEFVYAITDAGVRVATLGALATPLATAVLPLSVPPIDGYPLARGIVAD
ncbi:MAG: beta-propeller domain-containing protein [Proteobacteria bacterium]|nr:beta-propeller domain-containing protein [Pseudomonadota bacterium]